MTHLEENIAAAKAEELLDTIRRAIEADGFAEVPACMRRNFSKGHQGVPRDCEGLWSVTVKKGDNIVFLEKGAVTLGCWLPTEEGVAHPLFSLRMSAAEFLQRWAEVKKQENKKKDRL